MVTNKNSDALPTPPAWFWGVPAWLPSVTVYPGISRTVSCQRCGMLDEREPEMGSPAVLAVPWGMFLISSAIAELNKLQLKFVQFTFSGIRN